jgi:type IV secretion system protein VirB4
MSLLEKLLKKPKKDPNKLTAQKPDEDFIPYVAHYDPNTIITKNGELLQVIRITGFSNESVAAELISLRDAVRDAILDHVKDDKVAFWFNTIRRKKNIAPQFKSEGSKDFFAKKINDTWVKKNSWNDQYVNELYITIIVEGIDTSISNFKSFTRSFSHAKTKSLHQNFLEGSHKKLSDLVKNIMKDIGDYGAKLLGLSEWEGILYSEPMRFFGKIVNLYEERYPLSANDISNDLSSHKMAFGNREIEVVGYNNKNFAAMLSLKEYFEVSTHTLDRILQLPLEFIITQSFDFSYTSNDLKPHEYQDYMLQVSGDGEFRQISGIANFMESKHDLPTDYGKLQTTIMCINRTLDKLEQDIRLILDQFGSLGFVVIREDIFSEHCFWAQLPGNFRFLSRQKLINTYRVAGFAALHSFPAGLISGNYWGPALTVFRTVLNTPYFFNFHEADLGHTLIIGPKGSGKTVLLNFLLAQARKFDHKLIYIDTNNSARAFMKAISGHHYQLSNSEVGQQDFLRLNPLSLPKTAQHQNFLNEFFTSLVTYSKEPISESEMKLIPHVVERILVSNASNFALAIECFNNHETKNIYEKLKIWNSEKLGYIFGSKDEINWSDQLIGLDLTDVFSQKPIAIPVMLYLLYRIESAITGTSPAVVVIDAAWNLLDNHFLAPKINGFLARMRQKNCVVILSADKVAEASEDNLMKEIKKDLITQIFMPHAEMVEAEYINYRDVLDLSGDEIEIIRMMEKQEHQFLFKHGEDSIIATFNIDEFIELIKILSSDQITLAAMDEVIAANPDTTPDVWLPQLFEVLIEIERERREEEKAKYLAELARQRKALQDKMEAQEYD